MIENQPFELTLIYHSEKPDDKKTRAYVESLTEYAIKTLDLKRTVMTETQIAEIADKMGVGIHDLVDYTYTDRLPGSDLIGTMSKADVLTVLNREPILLNTPILIIGKKAYRYGSSYEFMKQSMDTGVQFCAPARLEERRDEP